MATEKDLGKVDAPVLDNKADIVKARLSQIDERIAANKAELKELTARRAAYVQKNKN